MSPFNGRPLPYVNRDVSWMYFNRRILQEAQRHDVPPLERLSFLGIYSNNLDEFFRVRMATISRIATLPGKRMKTQRDNARALFNRIAAIDNDYSHEYEKTVARVVAALAESGIRIVAPDDLTDAQRHFVKCFFRSKVSGFVSPVWMSRLEGFSRESDSLIYLAVEMSGPGRKTDYALIELPSAQCGRFVVLPDDGETRCVMYLDDVVRMALPMIFPGMGYDTFRAFSFKFTKDAEMEIDNDLHVGPLEKIAKAVGSRKKGAALRVIYDHEMPERLLSLLVGKLCLDKLDTVKPSGRYHNHKDFMQFPDLGLSSLRYPVWTPAVPPELKQTDSLMQRVEKKDRFVHVPYQTFDYVVRLLQEAAVSKTVTHIKITLYRMARNSKIVEALICAARNGKKVTAVVELLARFDESSNISWARKMQEAGVNVLFGLEGLKVHSKIVHIGVRGGKDIAVVGTGNFHEGNARVYTDYFLMTADPVITKDVEKVFSFIRHPYNPVRYRALMVSPNHMRDVFLRLIDDEIANLRKGLPAFIRVKINHITDEEMVTALYRASAAGVKVDLLVRGNDSVVTGVEGVSENIRAVGIIDRYLEHSRLFHFCAGGEDKVFIGSADWMPRNLDNRVEVVAPVLDPDIKADVINTIDLGLADNTHARVADGSGICRMVTGEPPLRSQEALREHYLALSKNNAVKTESTM